MPTKLMTTEEVAAHYRVGAETVRRWRREGTGPEGLRAVKAGRRWLYDTAELERFDSEAAA